MFAGLSVGWLATLIAGAPLSEEGVAQRVVEAVRAREQVVVVPWHLYLLPALRLVRMVFSFPSTPTLGTAAVL